MPSIQPNEVIFVLSLDSINRLDISTVRETLADVEKVLADIEIHVRGTQEAEVHWQMPEAPPLEFIASVNGASAEDLKRIVTEAEEGFSRVLTDGPIQWPESFGHNAKRSALRILKRLDHIEAIRVRALNHPEVVISNALDISGTVVTQKRTVKRVPSSVEGVLELISHRGQLRASIRELGTNHTVAVTFPDEKLKEIVPLFDKRVIVEGLVSYRKDGTPISVTNMSAIRERKSNRSLLEYIGAAPDLTGGASTEEFMDRVRG